MHPLASLVPSALPPDFDFDFSDKIHNSPKQNRWNLYHKKLTKLTSRDICTLHTLTTDATDTP